MSYICHHCGEPFTDGIIRNSHPFCNNDHCAEEFRRDQADRWAQGQGYASYEDRAEHMGITIADNK